MKKLLILALLAIPAFAQAQTPAVYYLDMLSGPTGAIITINGNNFGSTQGGSTVKINGTAASTYNIWSNNKLQVTIAGGTTSGAVVVNVGGTNSICVNHDDGCSFTVRSGTIYYIGPGGSDSNAGTSMGAPWATLDHADSTVGAGATIYVLNGFATGSACDGRGWHANFTPTNVSGTSTNPIQYVVYAGATASIGATSAGTCSGDTTQFSIRNSGPPYSNYLTFSGFTIRNQMACMEINQGVGWRMINNDCEGLDPHSQFATWQATGSSNLYDYGNNLHDNGGNAKLNSGMYFTSATDHLWIGWNTIGGGATTSSINLEIHSTGGNDQYDIHVHDNLIENARCNGVVFASVDPSMGPVELYNNTFYHNGTGPNPPDSSCGTYTNVNFSGTHDAGPLPSGNVQIYNNTSFDCAPYTNGGLGFTFGCFAVYNQGSGTSIKYQFTNNIFMPTVAEASYFASDSLTSLITGCSNNLYFQGGSPPAFCNGSAVTGNPLFVSTTIPNLNLQSGSPAIGAGSTSHVPTYDANGLLRPSPPSIGAYELNGAVANIGIPVAPLLTKLVTQ